MKPIYTYRLESLTDVDGWRTLQTGEIQAYHDRHAQAIARRIVLEDVLCASFISRNRSPKILSSRPAPSSTFRS
ncbi:MAG: hypothetical protein OXL96_05705 [Candidatus Poribacteria bacterium]|nr:hypothetical protein [Candidatus Poribacteria bacterium]